MKKISVFIVVLVAILFSVDVYAEESDALTLPIVMYHHISKRSETWNDYVVSIDEFRSDMEYLKNEGWESITVAELIAWQEGKFAMPEKPMMITFDDGFASVVEYAEPILNEYGFKGVVAVIGSVCDEYSKNGEYDPEWSDLSWESARDMVNRGVLELQCHTWDLHTSKGAVGCAKRFSESLGAYRWRLSTDLSKFIVACGMHDINWTYSIAYPFGSYDINTTNIVKDMGFCAAFTCTEEINYLTGDYEELYSLGRFNRPHGISSEKFFKNWKITIDMG